MRRVVKIECRRSVAEAAADELRERGHVADDRVFCRTCHFLARLIEALAR